MILPFVLILTLGSVEYATAVCGVCSTVSRAMCMTETTFKMCKEPITPGDPLIDPDPESKIIRCPEGKQCTAHEQICVTGGPPECVNKCGKCNAKKVFACVSENQYAFCFGETTPSAGFFGTCPTGQHCNVDQAPGYCTATGKPTCLGGDEQFPTTVSPTTPTTPTTASTASTASTPTTPPTSSPTKYCQTRPSGRYPVPGSCTDYIYCYPVGGSIVGQQYSCPKSTVFNPNTEKCVLHGSYPCPANT